MLSTEHDERLWDQLALHGAPLTTEQEKACKPNPKSLTDTLVLAVESLRIHPHQRDKARKAEALEALLLALLIHYPGFYKKLSRQHSQVASLLPRDFTGRHIKLKRIASAILATYL